MNIRSFNTKYLSIALSIVALVAYSFVVYAAAPAGGYPSGDELDPSCAPNTANCFVNSQEVERGTGAPASTPTGAEPVVYVDELTGDVYTWDGSTWNQLTGGGGGASYDLYAENYINGFVSPIATGDNAVAIGESAEATGSYAFSAGVLARSIGNESVALGSEAISVGLRSFAVGRNAQADGDNSMAIGQGVRAYAENEYVIGSYSTQYTPANDTTDRVFAVGNGTGNGSQSSNTLTIFKNDSFVFGDDNFTWSNTPAPVDEEKKLYFDTVNNAIRFGSVADTSWDTSNTGSRSTAIGFSDAGNVHTLLVAPIATGINSVAIGNSNYARSFGETALGFFNTDYTPGEDGGGLFDTSDRLFVIGNGSEDASRSDAFMILKNGKTGIGFDNFEATGENALLQVNGAFIQKGATGCAIETDADGQIICTVSDRNLKKDIVDMTYGLETLRALRPVEYSFKDTTRFGNEHQIGFIAQELEQVLPEVVSQGNEYLSVNYALLTSVITKAVQELDVKIQDIESAALDSEIGSQSLFGGITSWLGDAANGINELFASIIHSDKIYTNELCVGSTCLTETQVQQVLENIGASSSHSEPEPESPALENSESSGEEIIQDEVLTSEEGSVVEETEEVSEPEISQESDPEPETPSESEEVSEPEPQQVIE